MVWWDYRKILYVVNSLVADGGVERRNLEQILYLRERDLDVHVCALRALGATAERYRREGIPVHFFRAYRAGEAERNRVFWSEFLAFHRFLMRERFGVVVGSQAPSHYLARMACLPRLGRRVVAMERAATWNRKWHWRLLDALCAIWTDKILCFSPWVKDGLIQKGWIPSSKVHVVEGGYMMDSSVTFSHPSIHVDGAMIIGCISALLAAKGQSLLLEAFRRVIEKGQNVLLVLAGSGPDEDRLRTLTRRWALDSHVLFLGHVPHPHALYPHFDIFVFPSMNEGLGGVWVEAWLHGLPVVATGIRPMSDYIVHGHNGLLFRPEDPQDLARCLLRLLSDSDLRSKLGRNGRITAQRSFDFEKQMKKLRAILCPY